MGRRKDRDAVLRRRGFARQTVGGQRENRRGGECWRGLGVIESLEPRMLLDGQVNFAGKVDYATGSSPQSVAAGDFNGDSKADLAVVNNGGNTVSVLLGVGDGTFAAKVDYATGTGPCWVTAGDFNGDGKADLAVANASSQTVAVMLGLGDGTFPFKVDYATGTSPDSVTAADLNGDGKLDLVTANESSSTVSVFLNQGSGTFAPKADYTSGSGSRSVAAADLNGDGKIDLAVARTSIVSVLLNKGDGKFLPKTEYSTGKGSILQVVAADFSGDGKVDLAVANDNDRVNVLRNEGNGVFVQADFVAGTKPIALMAADLNGDGKIDLAVANQFGNTVSVLLNTENRAPVDISLSGDAVLELQPAGTVVGSLSTSDTDAGVSFAYELAAGEGGDDNGSFTVSGNVLKTTAILDPSVKGKYSIRVRSTDQGGLFLEKVLTVAALRLVNFAARIENAKGTRPGPVVAADFNGDGKADLAMTTGGTAPDYADRSVSVMLSEGDGTFAPKVDYVPGSNPSWVRTGDFNGDGKIDLAMMSGTSNTVTVLVNQGDGTFAASAEYGVGATNGWVTAADFNGDGKTDLAVCNSSDNGVGVLMAQEDGTFGAKVDYAIGASFGPIAAGDFNGDGKADLAMINRSGASVLLNKGDGTFGTKTNYATGAYPWRMVAADLNGDGRSDLAVSDFNSSVVSVLLSNADGTFAPKTDYAVVGYWADLTAADFNGDGTIDLAAVVETWSLICVLLNSGSGKFAPWTEYDTGRSPGSVAAGDFNGDGKVDLAMGSRGTSPDYADKSVSVLLNIGNTNRAPSDIALSNDTVPDGQSAGMMVGDFSTSDPDAMMPFTYALAGGAGSDDNASFTISNSTQYFLTVVLKTGATFDYQAKESYSIRVRSTDAMGMWVEKVLTVHISPATFAAQVGYNSSNAYGVGVADFNGDGKDDMAIGQWSGEQVRVALSNGNGTFVGVASCTTGSDPRSMATGDFNGDGRIDLAVGNVSSGTVSVLMGNGDGTFAGKVDYAAGTRPSSVTVADLDGDGKLDLAVTNSSGVSVLLNKGDGTFLAQADYVTGSGAASVAAADFDGDGKIDLAVANEYSDSVSVLRNQGDGTFASKVDVYYAADSGPKSVAAADFNGDGKIDLAMVLSSYNTVSVLMGNGDGTFSGKVDYPTGYRSSSPESVRAADLDGDGRIDLAVLNSYSVSVSVLRNKGDGTFAPKVDYAMNKNPTSFTAGDFNGDGKIDLAVANSSDSLGTVSVLLNSTPMPLILNSTGGMYLKRTGAYIEVWNNADGSGASAIKQALSVTRSLLLSGASGDGKIVLDFSGGNVVPVGGLTINTNGGNQTLDVIGSGPFGLSVTGGGVVSLGAVGGKVLELSGLSVEPGATLDVGDQSLVVQAAGDDARDAMLAAISGLIRNARDGGGWAKAGIGSSAARGDKRGMTGLGVRIDDQGRVVVKYTWNGDANGDGIVNADDYFLADSGYITQVGGWGNGDFNYDGVINADDYFLIDSAYIGQSGVLAASGPEPAVSADVAVQQKAKKAEPDGILRQLFSTEPVL